MSEFLDKAVMEANMPLVCANASSDTSDIRAVEGKTMKLCPTCLKKGKKSARKRWSKVIGPFYRNQFPENAKELPIKCSDHPIWRFLLISWLVSPPTSREGKVWYEFHFFAACKKCGPVRVEEREGIRRLSRLKRFENLVRHFLNNRVERIWPVE